MLTCERQANGAVLSDSDGRHASRGAALWIIYAALVGLLVRLAYVLSADFPLNDGGMFYAMARDIARAGYALPVATSYNQANIPFAYPPLSLYAAALLNGTIGVSLFELLRFLPLTANVLTIVAFGALAFDLLPSPVAARTAVFVFALHPRGFLSLIAGGGLTRSSGLLFAVLALYQIRRMYLHRSWRHAALAGVFAALALLSHLEMGLLVAVSALVFFVAHGRNRPGLYRSALVGALTLLGVAPWVGLVLERDGVAPFLNSLQSGQPVYDGLALLLTLRVSLEPLFPVLGGLGLLGLLYCVSRGRWLIPSWLILLYLLDARKAPMTGTIPLALLAGIGVDAVLLPLARFAPEAQEQFASAFPHRGRERPAQDVLGRPFTAAMGQAFLHSAVLRDGARGVSSLPDWIRLHLGAVAVVFALTYAAFAALAGARDVLAPVSPDERAAMAWIEESTPASDRFLIVTGEPWTVSRTAEWFPALADRVSVGTVQGTEWLPGGAYARSVEADRQLVACADRDAACLESWSAATGRDFDAVFVVKRSPTTTDTASFATLPGEDCCAALIASLRRDPSYTLAYDGPGAVVFQRRASD